MIPEDFRPERIYRGKAKGTILRDEKLGHHRKSDSLPDYIEGALR